jgi:hypothetical protein
MTVKTLTSALTEKQLATRWSASIKTLQAWRQQGKGPKYLKIGRAVRYTIDAIENFEAEVSTASTSQSK